MGDPALARAASRSEQHQTAAPFDPPQLEPTADKGCHPGVAGQTDGHRHLGLGLVREPEQAQGDPLLGESTCRLDTGLPGGQDRGLDLEPLGLRADADGGAGHDPETTLAAKDELPQIGTCGGGRQGGEIETTGRGYQVEACDEITDPAVAQGLLARGTGGDPAAQCGELPGLGKVSQRQAVLAQRPFERRPGGAGPKCGQPRFRIEALQTGEALQVEGDNRSIPGDHVDTASHRCATPPRNDPDAGGGAAFEHGDYLSAVARPGHPIGDCRHGSRA